MDNFAVWFMNGRDPMDEPRDRDLAHLRALHEARAAAAKRQTSLLGRLAASVRSTFRTEASTQPDVACCAA
jgi:hypothetical protein